MSQHDDLPSVGEVAFVISNLESGKSDPDGARRLLRLFCATVRCNGGPAALNPQLLEWLVRGFERHLTGEPIDKALGVRRRRGAPDQDLAKRNAFIVAEVVQLNDTGVPLRDNAEQSGAFTIVGEKYDLSEAQVHDIYCQQNHATMGRAIVELEKRDI